MLKIRLTYDSKHPHEFEQMMTLLKKNYRVLNQSKPYKGRGLSSYTNVYLDIEKEFNDETNHNGY